MRLAFVVSNKNAARYRQNPAFTYRCENLGQALQAQGHEVWLGHESRFPFWQAWDAVVFHRPLNGWRLRMLTQWLARRGTRLVADVDDLVFAPALAHYSPGVRNGQVPLADTQSLFQRHLLALQRFDCVTVSTAPLAAQASALLGSGVPVVVVPNAVHASWRQLPAPQPLRGPAVLGYLPGTRSHDRDFASVAPGLAAVLQQHVQTRLRITGPLGYSMPGLEPRVLHQPKLPFERYHEVFAGLHLNLAPLESTPFTECKSAIKVMEAAWWGMPTVCSRLPDALRFVGAGAVVADTPQDFAACVHELLSQPEQLAAQRQALRERVLPLADVHAVARHWLQAVMPEQERRA